MEWRYCVPVILAVIMFLLVGTIFERRLEAAIRRIIANQQARLQTRLQYPIIDIPPETSQRTKQANPTGKSTSRTEPGKGIEICNQTTCASEALLSHGSQRSLDDNKLISSKSVPQLKTLKLIYKKDDVIF